MKDKKVLFVAHVDGHIQAFHIPYLKLFKEEGYVVGVASNGDKIFDYCDHKYNICFQRNPLSPKNIKAYKMLKKVLDDNDYDIIHCYTPVGGFVARLANKNSIHYKTTKMIYTAHGFHFFKGNNPVKNFIFRTIEKYAAKYTDILITINKEDYENALKFKLKENGKVEYVPGVGIDTDVIKKTKYDRNKFLDDARIDNNETTLLLSVGEINRNKNQEVVIKALAKLPETYHYILCGIGENKENLEKIAKEKNVFDRVHFLGFRNDIFSIMKCCDIFVFPSKREGLPVSVMEAMACGLPCIVSDIRGNHDLVDQKGGYVIKLDNFENDLSDILINKKNHFDDMKKYNREKSEMFSLKAILSKMKSIYGLE